MEQVARLEVIDRDGWRKTFPLEKHLVHVGSDSHNDIVLDASHGRGVAARHLQLLRTPGQSARVINLGDVSIFYGPDRRDELEPRQTLPIMEGTTLTVGDYSITFYDGLGLPEAGAHASGPIGLELILPQARLAPGQNIEGSITVRNLGEEPGVQFLLTVEGLPPECYTIGPSPLLFPGAAKAIPFRLRHSQGPQPPAGKHELMIIATASEAYPDEKAVVTRPVEILPYMAHTLQLVDPGNERILV